MERFYLDHNASTPTDPRVVDAVTRVLARGVGNPSSLHGEGRAARRSVEDARDAVAAFLGVEPREIVFTSGATEANDLAVRGIARSRRGDGPSAIAHSAVEHPSVRRVCADLAKREGMELRVIPVDGIGRVCLARFEEVLHQPPIPALVAVMAVSNEMGARQPWEEIADLCRTAGVPLHVDGVQAVGKMPFRLPDPGAGTLSLSGHKFGGPKGVGALWVRRETFLIPEILGGGQERGRRAGTENVPGIVGLGVACEIAGREVARRFADLQAGEHAFLEELRSCVPELVLIGSEDPSRRLPGTMALRVPGALGETVALLADLRGVAVSVGSACSSGSAEPSPVLHALGLSPVENLETFRVSLCWDQGPESLRTAARQLGAAALEARGDAGSRCRAR